MSATKPLVLPPHKCGLFLTHNEHRNYYESAQDWLAKRVPPLPFTTPEEAQRAIDTDEVWVLQWYPETPVGFHIVAASTLEGVLEFATAIAAEEAK